MSAIDTNSNTQEASDDRLYWTHRRIAALVIANGIVAVGNWAGFDWRGGEG